MKPTIAIPDYDLEEVANLLNMLLADKSVSLLVRAKSVDKTFANSLSLFIHFFYNYIQHGAKD